MLPPRDLIVVELAATGAALAASLAVRDRAARVMGAITAALRPLARSGRASVLVCGVAAFAGAAATTWLVGWPPPRIHDEFAYLLSAETFLEGRLTNPTHPGWEHFESFHVLHRPSYSAKFPTGQGLLLAAGWILGGHPIVGVWLGVAFACAAVAWMLRAWLPPPWALLGGFVAVAQFGVSSYWSVSYWGGALAAGSGALVFGAAVRMIRDGRRGAVPWLAGVGLVGLALSRPYEGLVASLPVALALALWLVRRIRAGEGGAALRSLVPVAAVVAAGLFWIGLHNHAVTGDAFRMPYAAHDEQYAVAPPFLWAEPSPRPEYRHDVMRRFWTGFGLSSYEERLHWRGFLQSVVLRAKLYGWFFVGAVLVLPLLLVPRAALDRRLWMPALSCALVVLALLTATYELPHYAAPVTGPIVLLLVAAMRRWAAWRPGGVRAGRALMAATLVTLAVVTPLRMWNQGPEANDLWSLRRQEIEDDLRGSGGRHLVFVRYDSDHMAHREWVYNHADIDGSAVVWARDLGPERNRQLLQHFPERRVWLIFVSFSRIPQQLLEYDEQLTPEGWLREHRASGAEPGAGRDR